MKSFKGRVAHGVRMAARILQETTLPYTLMVIPIVLVAAIIQGIVEMLWNQ